MQEEKKANIVSHLKKTRLVTLSQCHSLKVQPTTYLFLDFNLSRQEGEITISEAVLCLRHNRIDHYLCM